MPEIRFVNSILINNRIPLQPPVLKDPVMLLLTVSQILVWGPDGKPTNEIAGIAYECVDTVDFKHFTIKIEGQKVPLMTNDELQKLRENGERVPVEFTNLTVMQYINRKKQSIEDSFKADDIHLVTK